MNKQDLSNSELRCFALCGFEAPDDYKRTAMLLVLKNVKAHKNISLPKLTFNLARAHRIPKEHTEGIVRGLHSSEGLGVILVQQLKKEVVSISNSKIATEWIDNTVSNHPELAGIV